MKNIIKIFTLLIALLTVTNTADARLRGDAATHVTTGSIIGGELDLFADAKCETKLGTDVAAGSTVYIKATADYDKRLGTADANGKVSFITAEQTINSGAAQTRGEIGLGDYVDVVLVESRLDVGIYKLVMPTDANIGVKVSAQFADPAPNQSIQFTSIADKYSVDENAAVGTLVAQMTVVDKTKADGEYESLNYTITCDYNADEFNEIFEVNEVNNFGGVRTVEIRVKNQDKLDFEQLKPFTTKLYVVNELGDYNIARFYIDINDLNEDFTLSNQTFTLAEKQKDGKDWNVGSVVGNVEVTASDNYTPDYSYKVTTNDIPFYFSNATNKLVVKDGSTLDYETKPTWTFNISVSDGEFTHSATITVNLTDVNEAPQISDCKNEYAIDENSATGKDFGSFTVSDPDAGDELTYSLTGALTGAADATVARMDLSDIFVLKETKNSDGKRLVAIKVKDGAQLDYEKLYRPSERNATYPITITATDTNGNSASVNTKIVIKDINESLTAQGGTFYLNEHSPIGSSLSSIKYEDNAKKVVAKVEAEDEDKYNPDFSKLSYKMSTNNTGNYADDAKNFKVDPRSGLITSNAEFDYETESKHQYTFMVTVSDGEFSKDVEVNVNIQDIEEITSKDAAAYKNQAPEITNSAPIEVAETKTSANGVIGNITATDPDTKFDPAPNAEWGYTNLRYMLNKVIEVNGSTDFPFEIDENTGAITIREGETLNYAKQKKYEFVAKVTDCPVVNGVSPLSTTAKITIKVTDDNTAPKFLTLKDVFEVEENLKAGTVVDGGNIVVYDEDEADIDNLVITINSDLFEVVKVGKTDTNTHESKFAIKTKADLDYEAIYNSEVKDAIFDVTLTIVDKGGNKVSEDCKIRVIDVNEEPAFDEKSYTFNASEGINNAQPLGNVSVIEPDRYNSKFRTLYYSLEGDDAAQFTIDANGKISTVKGTELDYETKDTYKFYAVATDKEHTVKVPVTVTIINEQEAPRFAEKSIVLLVDEYAEIGSKVGTVSANDDDIKNGKTGKRPTYSLEATDYVADDYKAFEIDKSNGVIKVKAHPIESFNTKHEYNVRVVATDGDDPSLTDYVDVVIKTRLMMENLFSAGSAFTSYVAPENMAVPEGLSAYAVTDIDGTSATIQQIDYLPQSVPVLIKRADKTENLYKATTGNGTAFYVNKLQINETDREVSAGELYLLYRDEFVLTSSGTLPAGSVYLPITDLAVKTRSLTIGNGEGTTSIENLTPALSESEGEWYDLQGRRLGNKPNRKGIYISNGRKVVIK